MDSCAEGGKALCCCLQSKQEDVCFEASPTPEGTIRTSRAAEGVFGGPRLLAGPMAKVTIPEPGMPGTNSESGEGGSDPVSMPSCEVCESYNREDQGVNYYRFHCNFCFEKMKARFFKAQKVLVPEDAVPTTTVFGEMQSTETSDLGREEMARKQVIKESFQPVAQKQTGQSRTSDTQQSVKEEEDQEKNHEDNSITASQLNLKEEALGELEESLVNCCNSTAQLLSCGTVGPDAEKKDVEEMKLDNCCNVNTPSQSSCTVGTVEGQQEMKTVGNCYNTNTPSQLSCSAPCIEIEREGDQEMPKSKWRVHSNKIRECVPVMVGYVGPYHAASDVSQDSIDTAVNPEPTLLYQPSSSQDTSQVSKASNTNAKSSSTVGTVEDEKEMDLELENCYSIKTLFQLSFSTLCNEFEKGSRQETNLGNCNNTIASQITDSKEEDVLEEGSDMEESEEELSSSEDEKKGNKSDSDWLEETIRLQQQRKKNRSKWKKKTLWVCKCKEKFTSQASYRKHRLEAHPVSCKYCEEKFHSSRVPKNHLKTHMPSEDKLDLKGNKLFLCDHCGEFFSSKQMSCHKLKISEARPYKCNVKDCKSSFKNKGYLKSHVRAVHDRNRLTCPYEGCKTTCRQKSELMTHYKVHTDERSHQCSYCGKMFRRGEHLRVHMRIHTGDNPFNCSLCNYGGRQYNSLRWHMKTHHPEHCKEETKTAKSKQPVSSYEIEECTPTQVDYIRPGHAVSNTSQDPIDTAANSGPTLLYQPSSSQDITQVSEVRNRLQKLRHKPKSKMTKKTKRREHFSAMGKLSSKLRGLGKGSRSKIEPPVEFEATTYERSLDRKKAVLRTDALVDKHESNNVSGSAKKTTPYSMRSRSHRPK
ncbi:uncharacterized protein [Branchiostoma lanceolatum]|uniref:uncharacterized protein n=1 Tax=Branchiostoma lanceolatum TaxID=7740 RepID=UPI003456692B